MSWDDIKYEDDDITSSDWNELVKYLKKSPKWEDYRGTSCTGVDGATSRTLTIGNTALTNDENVTFLINGVTLNPTADFTIAHATSSSVVTFLNAVWDTDYIRVQLQHETGV